MKNQRLLILSLILVGLAGFADAIAQTCTISGSGTITWSAATCIEGGVNKATDGVNIVVPNGVSLNINTNPNKVGNLTIQSGGTVTNNDNSPAFWNGSITVQNGGSLYIDKKIDMGTAANCGNKLIVESGGLLDITGGGMSGLITICGNPIASTGGGCNAFPAGPPPYCEPGGGWPSGGFTFDDTGIAGINYTWDGSSSTNWQTAANWTPDRSSLTTEDQLIFPTGGANQSITNVPTQTIGSISVTGGTYTFTPSASGNSLTFATPAGNASGNVLQINNGATLNQGAAGSALNITVISNGKARIGGQLNMVNGTFATSSGSTLTLHTNSAPLARTSGQASLNAASILEFGDATNTGGSTIVLPNSIFSAAQTVATLVVNRTNGATLGNQSITVTSAATFTLGDLNTSAAAPIIFSSTATSPTETSTSKIVGYAQMASRTVGTGALDFLGFSIASGANDVGAMTVQRRTGSAGANSFNGNQSINASWDVTATSNPAAGRNLVLRWVSTFDGVNSAANPFRTYFFNGGPGWTQIGTDAALTATTPLRTSAAKLTTDLNDIFTLTDNTQSLPVSFTSISAKAVGNVVNVSWSTATEINNDKFEIQKRGPEGFYSIGELRGAGNSVKISTYSFNDNLPMTGLNYYRVKQVDYDGNFSYSETVVARFDGAISIFPNPVGEGIINFSGIENEVAVTIQDLHGRILYKGTVNSDNPQIEVKNIVSSPGIYQITTQSGSSIKFHRALIK